MNRLSVLGKGEKNGEEIFFILSPNRQRVCSQASNLPANTTVSLRSQPLGTFSACNRLPLNGGSTLRTFIFLSYHSCGVYFLTIQLLRWLYARPFLAIVKETAKMKRPLAFGGASLARHVRRQTKATLTF